MKKLLALLLAMACVLSLSVSAFAWSTDPDITVPADTIQFDNAKAYVDGGHKGDLTAPTAATGFEVHPDNKVYFWLVNTGGVDGSDLVDSNLFTFKVKKSNDASKIVDSIKVVEKTITSISTARQPYIEVKFKEDMTTNDYKVSLEFTFTAKTKGVEKYKTAIPTLASGQKVIWKTNFWVKNSEEKSDDVTWDVGQKGWTAKPVKNEDNEVIWEDENVEIAKLVFTADDDPKSTYPKLTSKWDNEKYARLFADQDAFIRSFVGNPTISSTSRATMFLYSPYYDEDENETVDPEDVIIYQVSADDELIDVTAQFTITTDDSSDRTAFMMKTRTLGTYIFAEKSVLAAEEPAADKDVDDIPVSGGNTKDIPNTGC